MCALALKSTETRLVPIRIYRYSLVNAQLIWNVQMARGRAAEVSNTIYASIHVYSSINL